MKNSFSEMSEQERKDFLIEHFMYEVEMLFFALRQNIVFSKKINEGENNFVQLNNMALECFLLHAKILLEFFYDFGKTQKSSEIRAWHYYNSIDDYKEALLPKTNSIKAVEKRVNNEVSHLGIKRFSGAPIKKNWDTLNILHDFMSLVKFFVDTVPRTYYDEKLKNY